MKDEENGEKGWLCDYPWRYLFVNLSGEMSFCCTNTFPRGDLTKEAFQTIWNNYEFKKARSQFLDRRYIAARCLPTCQFLCANYPEYNKYFDNKPPDVDDVLENRKYSGLSNKRLCEPPVNWEENEKVVLQDIHAEATHVACMPTTAHIEIVAGCNLKCTFCDIGIAAPKLDIISSEVLDNIRSVYKYLTSIEILGGELFMYSINKSPLKRILDDINNFGSGNIVVLLVTNGIGLSEAWADLLTDYKRIRISLSISIDTVNPKDYRFLRVGGNLERLIKNIDRFVSLARKKDADVGLLFTTVLSKRTFRGIPELIRFIRKYDAKYFVMQPLQPTGNPEFYRDNCLFVPERRDEVLEFRKILESIEWENTNRDTMLSICQSFLEEDSRL